MTTEQALEEAQTRVNSFKFYSRGIRVFTSIEEYNSIVLVSAQQIAIIAIEKEMQGWQLELESTMSESVICICEHNLSYLQSILDQIPNTI